MCMRLCHMRDVRRMFKNLRIEVDLFVYDLTMYALLLVVETLLCLNIVR